MNAASEEFLSLPSCRFPLTQHACAELWAALGQPVLCISAIVGSPAQWLRPLTSGQAAPKTHVNPRLRWQTRRCKPKGPWCPLRPHACQRLCQEPLKTGAHLGQAAAAGCCSMPARLLPFEPPSCSASQDSCLLCCSPLHLSPVRSADIATPDVLASEAGLSLSLSPDSGKHGGMAVAGGRQAGGREEEPWQAAARQEHDIGEAGRLPVCRCCCLMLMSLSDCRSMSLSDCQRSSQQGLLPALWPFRSAARRAAGGGGGEAAPRLRCAL